MMEAARLPVEYIEAWLAKRSIAVRELERGTAFCTAEDGQRVPLTVSLIEDKVAQADPVAWAFLNLTERKATRDEDTKEIVIPAGGPWVLFPVQADLARIQVDHLIVECAAQVGKTRDIILGTLWEMDCATGNIVSLVAADADNRLDAIWNEFEFQIEKNPGIGGGLKEKRVKPYRRMSFENGNEFYMLICGHDGSQFRGFHATGTVRADEVAKWKYQLQFDELWRALMPGARSRIYSTPDGDYSSPFYAMCARAQLIGLRAATKTVAKPSVSFSEEPTFFKTNITKMQLPYPMWSEKRAARLREQWDGEHTPGYLMNVLGQWGTPCFSVFPMPTLRPNLKGAIHLPHYRMVAATIDRERRQVLFNASRLASGPDTADGGPQEEILAREVFAFLDGRQLGEMVANFFPPLEQFGPNPRLYCGADLGFSQDPTEAIFVRAVGPKWSDIFRVHLKSAEEPEQAAIFAWLDHASGHQVQYSFDNGSSGNALIGRLANDVQYQRCPAGCKDPVYFGERLSGRGFGEYAAEIDLDSGEPLLNPDRKDTHGNPMPHRRSNKELSTRILERKAQAKQLEIAWDAGAGNANLSSAQLMVNHTWLRMTSKQERVFKGTDDHHVDARRQVALAIVSEMRGTGLVNPTPENFVSAQPRPISSSGFVEGGGGSLRAEFARPERIFSDVNW
jgi:hypothetical protein